MNNKIENPKIEIEKGIKLNDKDYITCLLSKLKDLVKNYTVALTEASNEYLYNEYKSIFDKYSTMQREVFELMFQKGFYSLEEADENKINEKYNLLNQDFVDLNS